MFTRIATFSLTMLLAAVSLGAAADFTGRWEGSTTLPDGTPVTVAFNFATDNDGQLSGVVDTVEFGSFTATDIVVEGEQISFNVPTDNGIYSHTGTLRADGLWLEGMGPDGAIPGALYKRPAANLAGTWRGKIETPDGPAEVVYTFTVNDGTYAGTSRSMMGEVPLQNITVDGAKVAFESNYSGFMIKRRGTIRGDTMDLTVSIDGNEFAVTFTRDSASPN